MRWRSSEGFTSGLAQGCPRSPHHGKDVTNKDVKNVTENCCLSTHINNNGEEGMLVTFYGSFCRRSSLRLVVLCKVTVSNRSSNSRPDCERNLNEILEPPLGNESLWLPAETTNFTSDWSAFKTMSVNSLFWRRKLFIYFLKPNFLCMSATWLLSEVGFLNCSPRVPGAPTVLEGCT